MLAIRPITHRHTGYRTQDGAGVSLVRVLGNSTVDVFDPFLMMDAFDSTDPRDYEAGFPMHPHRGIETVTFLSSGAMVHRDHLGTEASVGGGGAQWLTAGSGAYHEEMPRSSSRMLGTQLWLNMRSTDKMAAAPEYFGIAADAIPEVELPGGRLRVIAGDYRGAYGEAHGHQGKYLPLDYYDVHLAAGSHVVVEMPGDRSAMAFTLVGDAKISGEDVSEKTAVKLGEGDSVEIVAGEEPVEVLLMSSVRLDEPVAWYGPVVMNTREELLQAFSEMDEGTFVKQRTHMSK